MSSVKKLMMSAAGGGSLDVDDVFSTYLYHGTQNSQTITNNIDLATEGGMVWFKARDAASSPTITDTVRGAGNYLETANTAANNYASTYMTSFNTDGFTLGAFSGFTNNDVDYASWTFRKAPKFFDVVTVTTSGSNTNLRISHSLGTTVGCIIAKRADGAGDWVVWHNGLASATNSSLNLNLSASVTTRTNTWGTSAPTSTDFGIDTTYFGTGVTYIFYLFAHNDGDGEFGPNGDQDIIKCGSYTGNGNGEYDDNGTEVNLGFEPQWIMIKNSDWSGGDWQIFDTMRGITSRPGPTSRDGDDAVLYANQSYVEDGASSFLRVTPTGFKLESDSYSVNNNFSYVYMAIRRGSLFPPESATDVFAADYGGNASSTPPWFTSGFPVDLGIHTNKASANNRLVTSRLLQGKYLKANETHSESNISGAKFDFMDGFYNLSTSTSTDTIGWAWKRAPGFFDVVTYRGNSTAGRTVSHNLGVAPEMMWVKNRITSIDWWCYHKDLGNTKYVKLNTPDFAFTDSTAWNNTTPSDTVFTLGTSGRVNYGSSNSGDPYIAYLFATLPGISKVGSYTGDGTINGSKFIDCGFSNGPALVIIKIYEGEDAGHWHIFDTTRGLVAGNDSLLYLNRTTAEGTGLDYIDPHSSGFFVGCASNTKNNTNVLGSKYIFYAIAA